MAKSAQQKMEELAKKIAQEVVASAGAGLTAGRIFLQARIKETLSTPAPRRKVGFGYAATTRATPGAPPRKLSGRLRASVTGKTISPTEEVIGASAKSDDGFDYAKYHEIADPAMLNSGKHRYMQPTVDKYRQDLLTIIGSHIKVEIK